MADIIKVGDSTYRKVAKPQRRIRYKRETRYGSILNRNARQRANLAEDKLKEIRFKSKLQKEKRTYEQDRKALRTLQKREAQERRKAFFNKVKSGGSKVYNANVSNPFTKKKKQQEQENQKNFRNAFEASRENN